MRRFQKTYYGMPDVPANPPSTLPEVGDEVVAEEDDEEFDEDDEDDFGDDEEDDDDGTDGIGSQA